MLENMLEADIGETFEFENEAKNSFVGSTKKNSPKYGCKILTRSPVARLVGLLI